MIQSDIIKASYEAIFKNLSELGEKTGLFLVSNEGFNAKRDEQRSLVCLAVSDICQLCPDKNGEKIDVGEVSYEIPAQIGCVFLFTVINKSYPQLLEVTGLLIQYLKDNNKFILENHKWHGEDEGRIIIEPVIRQPRPQWENRFNDLPSVTLEYRIEFGINSLKGSPFKRVEKRDIKGNIK